MRLRGRASNLSTDRQLNGGEGDESTVAALQESSTASAAAGGGRSPPPQRAGGAAVQRKPLGRGGCRGSVRNCGAAAVADTGLQQRVALLEQQLEQQAGALSQIAEALRRVGAALEVELGPLPLPTVPSASPSLHSTGARVTNSEQTT